ncbi:hypothetical protein PLESTB_000507300 [Pleodorina starrii]|uniref:Uncharacterized protein n=1 Tax=Pleodorina starrii TaxID=330485 RepID=A0A9W6BFY9_9CHLO|nr:hypothetical protein PLESTM_000122100 [Pleodorina starrii]GLC51482.1 hypothetical protein PLESTB_000507300 [Pleodorina starrii]GLC67700.1 hypothetical protein PLESTF_000596100 [Pleodorina starrii]
MTASFSISGDYVQPQGVATFWRLEENKVFEVALAKHFMDVDRYERIAAYLPNKTASDVQKRFRELEDDLRRIEEDSESASAQSAPSPVVRSEENAAKKPKTDVPANGDRRKGVPWTEEEHRLFLLGLAKFGKGDWRSIARNFVVSRTPTQVASHAQKYFIRLNSLNKKDKRRASIHDITSPTLPASALNANPTTGIAPSNAAPGASAAAAKPPSAAASAAPSSPVSAPTAAAPTVQSAAAAAMAAAAAAAAASTSNVFAQLAMHGMSIPPSGMVPPMAMPSAPFMVQV